MMKLVAIVIVNLLTLSLVVSGVSTQNNNKGYFTKYKSIEPVLGQVCIRDYCFDVEIAAKPKERKEGLMMRKSLRVNSGMLFLFDHLGKYSFWMKNTLIPLDIIWINDKFEVVYIARNAAPCLGDDCALYTPDRYAKYVLEINGGLSGIYKFRVGDKVRFNEKR